MKRLSIVVLAVFALGIFLSGCGQEEIKRLKAENVIVKEENVKLKKEIETLQAENEAMKAKIAKIEGILKSQPEEPAAVAAAPEEAPAPPAVAPEEPAAPEQGAEKKSD